ncbi:MAG TPA: flavodoxin family protein [Thermodesulfobacteriota bacterium]|nr:flavodoxin family protein [Thermodesulfobacteriota bacterium]
MKKIKILGISGSPRKANTDILLEEALKSAGTLEGIVTERIYLRDTQIRFCIGCFKCFDENRNDYACQIHRDSMDEIYPTLKECHGLILATPVYFGQISGQMKNFMDRTEPLLRYAKGQWKFALKDKVGGAIAVGGNRNGGQETTLQAIHHFFLIHDMVIVGTGPDERPGCYLGVAATTHPKRGRIKDAVREDELGIKAARILGKRVGEVTRRYFSNDR